MLIYIKGEGQKRGRENSKQALFFSAEPDVALDLTTVRPRPEPKSDA